MAPQTADQPAPSSGASDFYAARRRHHATVRAALERRARTLSRVRLAIFAAIVALLVLVEPAVPRRTAMLLLAGVLSIFFAALVVHHGRVRRATRRAQALETVNAEAERRVLREWNALPARPPLAPPPIHPYARDLDVFGSASLMQLLAGSMTTGGRAMLRDWLLEPAAPPVVQARQGAVIELAGEPVLREELSAGARLAGPAPMDEVDRFLVWAESEPWLARSPILVWGARLLTAATLVLGLLHAVGVLDRALWVAPVALGLALTARYGRRARETIGHAVARENVFRHHGGLLERIARTPLADEHLRALQERIALGRSPAPREIARLGQLASWAEVKHSPILYFPLQLFLLWDFHLLGALERWQATAGRRARGWLGALAETEALAALATLRHDNPDWCMPEIVTDGPTMFEAEALAHPLLPAGVRVANDVVLGPPGSCLLVTGSNMSGKSTLLRAIGLNAVLAQCGGPACARRLRMAPLSVETSMQIEDSLERGLSRFMAELNRLKGVVEAARRTDAAGGPALLYLLDEILQGTNTAERQVAARRILRHLLEHQAIGAVTTHDLALADVPDLAAACRPVHFTEQVTETASGASMTFDYQLRPGIATSVNALRLMELVGLG